MTNEQKWVQNWKVVGKLLQDQRDEEIKLSDTKKNIQLLDWAYKYSKENFKQSETSGMVDFYKILVK